MNLCKDCAHYKKNADNIEASECMRKPQFSPISGNLLPTYCNLERAAWGTCKPEGNHFTVPMTQDELDADREIKSREWERWIGPGDTDYERLNRKLGI